MPRISTRWLVAVLAVLAVAGLTAWGLIGWGLRPPSAATLTPSPTPPPFASGTLVLRLAELRGIGPYELRLSLYADGRVLTRDPATPDVVQAGQTPVFLEANTPIFMQRRLSPTGVALLTSAADATGFFERSHDVPTDTKPGANPPATEAGVDLFVRVMGGQRVQVTTAAAEDPGWMAHSDERVALNRLASRLEDLTWLPDDAWADPAPRLYDGGRWLILSGATPPFQRLGAAGPPDALIWFSTFATDPVDFGAPFTSADGARSVENRCAVVSSAELNGLVGEFTRAGFGQAHAWFGSIVLPWAERDLDLHLAWRLLLPDEAPGCGAKAYPPAITP